MSTHLGRLNDVVKLHAVPEIEIKPDGTPVTKLDLALSEIIEEIQQLHFFDTVFYSEEKYSLWRFPLLALDPLDGTQEYIDGRPEWVLSIGLFENEIFQGEGWIYNPLTGECFERAHPLPFEQKVIYCGEVSRSECKSGLFTALDSDNIKIVPTGSIAYKLGRLSQGKSDFVVSLRPKNIWDIAGGTNLCHEAGLKFYSQGKLVTKVEKSYQPPLIWCSEELYPMLSKTFA
jgi:myo-inositol-1(or 4)-monophosphatase